MMTKQPHKREGYTLVEALVTLAVIAIATTTVTAKVRELSGLTHLRVAAGSVAATLHQARSEAIRRGRQVGLRFERRNSGSWVGVAYLDGDGDGVKTDDIRKGTDTEAWRRPVEGVDAVVRFGIIEAMSPTDPGDPKRKLQRLDDPIRFGRSNIASFGPLGTSTPGSIYLRDGDRRQAVVRLYGRTAKLRVMHYQPRNRLWK